ncbi:MAG TPA: hypothetical protein VMM60_17445 [Ilumatobacter sp.]|nr:hypothetical protein [Ilumatobacter sp.]
MAAIQDEVLAAFLARIATEPAVSDQIVEGLRKLLAGGNIPKAATVLKLIVDGGDALT